ncbi:hypothetical protein E2C01_072802 [Portunus trituberculatus]|uniref:Uncharacterized protein n=1 Tax=Portunus trituberculatus TaxID=210409 RepID=A0A5B7IBN5_PORTR|nr:hypothetical protein [Portunus trituberculatus]
MNDKTNRKRHEKRRYTKRTQKDGRVRSVTPNVTPTSSHGGVKRMSARASPSSITESHLALHLTPHPTSVLDVLAALFVSCRWKSSSPRRIALSIKWYCGQAFV